MPSVEAGGMVLLNAAGPERTARRPAQLLYRVVEVVRDGRGRLREEGRIWHTDLHQVRRFARAVAGDSTAHRLLVADGAGRIIEELRTAPGPSAQPTDWGQWKQIQVPTLVTPPGGHPRLRRAPPRFVRPAQPLPAPPALVDPVVLPAPKAEATEPSVPTLAGDEPAVPKVEIPEPPAAKTLEVELP